MAWTSRFYLILCTALILLAVSVADTSASDPGSISKPNILLIVVDDLRPELTCYGASDMVTPNIDQLAAEGVRFNRAYCQQAVCLPSRISMFTGMRPDSTGVHDLSTKFRETIPAVATITQHMRKSGYTTIGTGKVYHDEQPEEWDQWIDSKDLPGVSEYHLREITDSIDQRLKEAKEKGIKRKALRQYSKGPSVESADVSDSAFEDGAMTDRIIEVVAQKKSSPFFLTVGYHKPHLPFVAPKKYWDLYDRTKIQIPANYFLPKDSPRIAHMSWGELRAYTDIPKKGPVSRDKALELIHGYYASVSFADAQIGRLMEAVMDQGLDKNTVVILVSDHGWKLGEHAMWCKHTNYEIDARVPMIVKMPGGIAGGTVCNSMVELIDIFPTICELTGIETPSTCEGVSLQSLLNTDPNDDVKRPEHAFSQYKRSRKKGGDIIGYSLKVTDARYTEWINVESNKTVATEYYDHAHDPDENQNVAVDLDPTKKESLSNILRAQASRLPDDNNATN